MNAGSWVDGAIRRLTRRLLPARCLLCGADGSGGLDLCAGCRADLPRNTRACRRCAVPLESPAEVCGACLQQPPPFSAAWAPFRYAHPLDLLETRFKFQRNLAAGQVLAQLMAEAARELPAPLPQLLVCVPLHPRRLRQRGYNQALELARPLARALRLPLRHDVLRRARDTAAQSGLDAKSRRRNLRDAFVVTPGLALPAHVALIDDVMTTGTTLAECAKVLCRAGVESVDVWALARAPAPH